MIERIVKIRGHQYYVEVPNPRNPDQTRIVKIAASRGATIEVSEDESDRGDRLGAFYTQDELDAIEAREEAAAVSGEDPDADPDADGEDWDAEDVEIAGEDELIGWIEDATVPQVLAAAGDSREAAEKLLAAEEAASNDSRKGVVEGLAAILNRDNS